MQQSPIATPAMREDQIDQLQGAFVELITDKVEGKPVREVKPGNFGMRADANEVLLSHGFTSCTGMLLQAENPQTGKMDTYLFHLDPSLLNGATHAELTRIKNAYPGAKRAVMITTCDSIGDDVKGTPGADGLYQQEMVKSALGEDVTFAPTIACPGPAMGVAVAHSDLHKNDLLYTWDYKAQRITPYLPFGGEVAQGAPPPEQSHAR